MPAIAYNQVMMDLQSISVLISSGENRLIDLGFTALTFDFAARGLDCHGRSSTDLFRDIYLRILRLLLHESKQVQVSAFRVLEHFNKLHTKSITRALFDPAGIVLYLKVLCTYLDGEHVVKVSRACRCIGFLFIRLVRSGTSSRSDCL